MTSITDKRFLVTGATGGLGSRISSGLAAHGARLALSARNEDSLIALPLHAERYVVDLNHPESAAALIATVAAEGPIDGLVLAHGVVAFGPVDSYDDATCATLTQLNHLGPIQLIRSALPALRASATAGNSPCVLTISGVISELPTAGLSLYGAGKSGLLGFVRASQRELKRDGVRLLDARPPHTETGLATRAVRGAGPQMRAGLDPDAVAARIVTALLGDETDLPPEAFAA